MIDKAFVKLNEEELKDVVGGILPEKKYKFLKMDTIESAMEYLKMICLITPSDEEFNALMKEWEDKHSKTEPKNIISHGSGASGGW